MTASNIPLEKDILSSIIKYLKYINIGTVLRHNTGSFNAGTRFVSCGMKGTSDISVELYNKTLTLWFEVKRPKLGVLSPEQYVFLLRQQSRGNIAEVVHSVNEVKEILINNQLIQQENK